mmetsp:Transcript_35648/g.100925  ORF Transcript_35648/g.100925 Transcript_35648/m.100925 type:complete len:369 (-) Transcript_35648:462-1568(-)|eukprot:CAMPEP_0117675642 /NCGR_PEP_ID=MMETSP0804-20121206/15723_1 /TAXON_ID=1074897 /ORGANISM="Tetraselmis astigmatica, Strain CCMP880" /LENGTH=368 /DNA_ID=CAMNT_0005484677 /DNA_START=213 /DNA_END=1319 /DNA_ORIENTATION=+
MAANEPVIDMASLPVSEDGRLTLGTSWAPLWPANTVQQTKSNEAPPTDDSSDHLGDWEILTDAGSTISQCGTPRSMTGLSAKESFSPLDSPAKASTHDTMAHELFAVDKESSESSEDLLCAASDEAALVTHPNSEVASINSRASSPRPDSPNSADIVIARAEVVPYVPQANSWLQLQRGLSEASTATSASSEVTAAPLPEALLDGSVMDIAAVGKCLTLKPSDYVLGHVGNTMHRLWEWTSGKLEDLHGMVQQLGCVGNLRAASYPQFYYSTATLEDRLPKKRATPVFGRFNRLLVLLGCTNVVLGFALGAAMLNCRSLSARLRQKDNELSTLLMKVLSLQESLHIGGARRYPPVSHAMTPIKLEAYM